MKGINCLYQSNREKKLDLSLYDGTHYKGTMEDRKYNFTEIIANLVELIKKSF